MGLESARQDQLGRIDPGLVVPRGPDPSLNSAPATAAMIEAFRNGQISAADIADRAARRPLVEAATDPETLAAQKASVIAKGQMDTMTVKQAQEAARIPPGVLPYYQEVVKAGIMPPVDIKNWSDTTTQQVARAFGDLSDFHKESAKAKMLGGSVASGKTIDPATQQEFEGPISSTTREPLNRDAVQGVANWAMKYANDTKAWLQDGKPPVHEDLFSAPGTITTAPASGTSLPVDEAPAPSGRLVGLAPNQNRPRTEIQSKALYFVTASNDADKNLEELAKKGFNPSSVSNAAQAGLSKVTFGATEGLKGDNLKKYEAAAFAWTDSFLRMQSGAAISQNEIIKLSRGFFPQFGDSPAVQQQKAKTRAKLEIMGKAVASGQPIDQEALDNAREQATSFSDLHEKANKTGKQPGIFTNRALNGKRGTIDNSDPAHPRFIPDDSGGPLVQPK